MNNSHKADYSGRLYWSPKTSRIWLKDGRMRDLGCQDLDEMRSLAVRFGLELFVNGRQILPTHENGLISSREDRITAQ